MFGNAASFNNHNYDSQRQLQFLLASHNSGGVAAPVPSQQHDEALLQHLNLRLLLQEQLQEQQQASLQQQLSQLLTRNVPPPPTVATPRGLLPSQQQQQQSLLSSSILFQQPLEWDGFLEAAREHVLRQRITEALSYQTHQPPGMTFPNDIPVPQHQQQEQQQPLDDFPTSLVVDTTASLPLYETTKSFEITDTAETSNRKRNQPETKKHKETIPAKKKRRTSKTKQTNTKAVEDDSLLIPTANLPSQSETKSSSASTQELMTLVSAQTSAPNKRTTPQRAKAVAAKNNKNECTTNSTEGLQEGKVKRVITSTTRGKSIMDIVLGRFSNTNNSNKEHLDNSKADDDSRAVTANVPASSNDNDDDESAKPMASDTMEEAQGATNLPDNGDAGQTEKLDTDKKIPKRLAVQNVQASPVNAEEEAQPTTKSTEGELHHNDEKEKASTEGLGTHNVSSEPEQSSDEDPAGSLEKAKNGKGPTGINDGETVSLKTDKKSITKVSKKGLNHGNQEHGATTKKAAHEKRVNNKRRTTKSVPLGVKLRCRGRWRACKGTHCKEFMVL